MTVWEFNSGLAKSINDELQPGQRREVAFEEFAGTSGSFIEAAKGYGLCIVGNTGEVVTVQKQF